MRNFNFKSQFNLPLNLGIQVCSHNSYLSFLGSFQVLLATVWVIFFYSLSSLVQLIFIWQTQHSCEIEIEVVNLRRFPKFLFYFDQKNDQEFINFKSSYIELYFLFFDFFFSKLDFFWMLSHKFFFSLHQKIFLE